MGKLVHGLGINDVDYKISRSIELPKTDGKRNQKIVWICPYYQKWQNMLYRCGEKYQKAHPSYTGCTIHPDWIYLSSFIKWVDSQPNKDWQTSFLDKDVLRVGNKVYSPNNCAFVEERVNKFILDRSAARGEYLIGCYLHRGKFKAKCGNPFTKESDTLGYFHTELEAHLAWKAKKHELACQLADLQSDPRVAEALRKRYSN
jgi:hypothetical protein